MLMLWIIIKIFFVVFHRYLRIHRLKVVEICIWKSSQNLANLSMFSSQLTEFLMPYTLSISLEEIIYIFAMTRAKNSSPSFG